MGLYSNMIFFTLEVHSMKRSLIAFLVLLIFPLLIGPNSYADKKSGDQAREMTIKGIAFDQNAQSPVVLLADKNDETMIPIWIGLCEARSIEIGLSGLVPPRPLTYDLVAAVIRTLGARVVRVVIVDLRDNVYYAQVEISANGNVSIIDARPSDALALAHRMNSPIYVRKSVLDKAAIMNSTEEKREL